MHRRLFLARCVALTVPAADDAFLSASAVIFPGTMPLSLSLSVSVLSLSGPRRQKQRARRRNRNSSVSVLSLSGPRRQKQRAKRRNRNASASLRRCFCLPLCRPGSRTRASNSTTSTASISFPVLSLTLRQSGPPTAETKGHTA
eukprot:468212-Prorocentrum_lima.AAC.1